MPPDNEPSDKEPEEIKPAGEVSPKIEGERAREAGSSKEPPANPERPAIEVDDLKVVTSYANFCRVSGTPEELIIDLGLNSQPYDSTEETIGADQRIVLNYYSAKRMLHALHLAVQRHEQAFGVLETDIRKRVIGREKK